MNNDRELLELAAKAAGIEHKYWDGKSVHWPNKGFYRIDASGTPTSHHAWNPLTDDGDALRLAVKLGMMVSVGDDGFCTADTETLERSIDEVAAPDPYAATRRAIVRAAAEIGKELP